MCGAVLAHKTPVRRNLFIWREIQKFKTEQWNKINIQGRKIDT